MRFSNAISDEIVGLKFWVNCSGTIRYLQNFNDNKVINRRTEWTNLSSYKIQIAVTIRFFFIFVAVFSTLCKFCVFIVLFNEVITLSI